MKQLKYKITILMNGLQYTAQGATMADAFDALGLDFQKVKTKGEITVEYGTHKATRLIQLPKLRRYFLSKLLRNGLIRDFEKLLA